MAYIVSTSVSILEQWQSEVDVKLGYPENINIFQNVGLSVHAPLELGRAMHYAEILSDQANTRWALPFTDVVPIPEGATVVDELPSDWFPLMEMV